MQYAKRSMYRVTYLTGSTEMVETLLSAEEEALGFVAYLLSIGREATISKTMRKVQVTEIRTIPCQDNDGIENLVDLDEMPW